MLMNFNAEKTLDFVQDNNFLQHVWDIDELVTNQY